MKRLLTEALKQAATAHHEYEKTIGHADPNWAEWYAEWMLKNTHIEPLYLFTNGADDERV